MKLCLQKYCKKKRKHQIMGRYFGYKNHRNQRADISAMKNLIRLPML